jgi:hypothetical protein
VWMNCLSRFSQSIPCLLFSVLVLATSGDVSRGQEQSDSGALAERVRSFNRELDRSLSSSPAPVSSILAQRAARMFELMESDPRAAIRLSLSAEQAARLSVVSPDAKGSIESQGECTAL